MAAVTPNFDASELSALASRMLDVDSMPWESTRFPGIEIKTLLKDSETGLLTTLVRMAPGARLPDHEHVEIEQTWILEGSLADHEGEVSAGNYVWRPAGSRHEAWSPNGGSVSRILLQTQPVLRHRGRRRHLRSELRRLIAPVRAVDRHRSSVPAHFPSPAMSGPTCPVLRVPRLREHRHTVEDDGWARVSFCGQSSSGRTSWAKRSIASSALSTFSGTKSSVKCSAPISM